MVPPAMSNVPYRRTMSLSYGMYRPAGRSGNTAACTCRLPTRRSRTTLCTGDGGPRHGGAGFPPPARPARGGRRSPAHPCHLPRQGEVRRPSSRGRHREALERNAEVGEDLEVRHADISGRRAVLDRRSCTIRHVLRRHQRVGQAGDRPQLDGDDIVENATPIGESSEVATDEAPARSPEAPIAPAATPVRARKMRRGTGFMTVPLAVVEFGLGFGESRGQRPRG